MRFKPVRSILLGLVLGAALLPSTAGALPLILDYTGFTYGPIASFKALGVVDGFSLGVNNPAETYTYMISNLSLLSTTTYSDSQHLYTYGGGTFDIYQSTDASNRGYNYGISPPNLTAPATFTDGILWLGGPMDTFSMYVDDTQKLGSIDATGRFNSGIYCAGLGGPSFFSFAGLTSRIGNGIPFGYKQRMDGQADLNTSPVPEPASLFLVGFGLSVSGLAFRRRRSS